MAPVYMAPISIKAELGSIEKVIGTRTATAIVAVSPGSDPITVPETTPNRARRRFTGVSAAKRYSIPGIMQILVSIHNQFIHGNVFMCGTSHDHTEAW
jgi:hypothetical protein